MTLPRIHVYIVCDADLVSKIEDCVVGIEVALERVLKEADIVVGVDFQWAKEWDEW